MHTRPAQLVVALLVGLEVLESIQRACGRMPMETSTRYEMLSSCYGVRLHKLGHGMLLTYSNQPCEVVR